MIKDAIQQVADGKHLTQEQAYATLTEIMDGEATEAQIGGLLMALRMKGEQPAEVAGFARAMREHALRVPVEAAGLVDTCGTGGDSLHTFNISTLAAFVAAGAGVTVAKHGNRAVSSQCGSADVLRELGVNVELGPEQVARCLREVGIGFLFAPRLHPAMSHAAGPRRELGLRTVFNILGPLTNPAGARRQLLGAFSPEAARLMAEALAALDTEHAMVVHGEEGLDEISTCGPTQVLEVRQGSLAEYTLTPESLGVPRATLEDLAGGEPPSCAALFRRVLEGEKGPRPRHRPGQRRRGDLREWTGGDAGGGHGEGERVAGDGEGEGEVGEVGGGVAAGVGRPHPLAPSPCRGGGIGTMTILDQIIERRRERVEEEQALLPLAEIKARLAKMTAFKQQPRSFAQMLRGERVRVIAEIKRRSPSEGELAELLDPRSLAQDYSGSGAAAVSVITERDYFDGDPLYLSRARSGMPLPVLRKDFIVDEYQIYEARMLLADAVLLIADVLSEGELRALLMVTSQLGMEALVETHDEAAIEKALFAGAKVVGINNRDLTTMRVDLATTERLARKVPLDNVLVSESGIKTVEDVQRLAQAGVDAVLVGTTLMRAENPGWALRGLTQVGSRRESRVASRE